MQKTRRTNKLLAMLLALVMVLTMLPMGAMAADTVTYSGISVNYENYSTSGLYTPANVSNVVVAKERIQTDEDVPAAEKPTALNAVVSVLPAHVAISASLHGSNVFINSIAGYPNDTCPGYWIYLVNGVMADVAINKYLLDEGDHVSVLFVPSEFEEPSFAWFQENDGHFIGSMTGGDSYQIEVVANEVVYLQMDRTIIDFTDYRTVPAGNPSGASPTYYIDGGNGSQTVHTDANGQAEISWSGTHSTSTMYGGAEFADGVAPTGCRVKVVSGHSVTADVAISNVVNDFLERVEADYTPATWAAAKAAYDEILQLDPNVNDYVKYSARNKLERELYDLMPVNESRLGRLAISFGDEKQYLDKSFSPDAYFYTLSPEAPSIVTIIAEAVNPAATITYQLNGAPQSSNVITDIPIGQSQIKVIVSAGTSGSAAYIINVQRASGSDSLYAYMPAAGQFVNEGMDTSGGGTGYWGDPYTASGTLKELEGIAPLETGISLGSYGGYMVYDFGENGIPNEPYNKFGIDFIVYGNSVWNDAEPGAVQVSVDGTNWYDLAGDKYYTSHTTTDYHVTYGNPTPSDNSTLVTYDNPTLLNNSTLASVPWTVTGWPSGGFVEKNNYHDHSWFPLEKYYLDTRTISGLSVPEIAKIDLLPFVDYATNQSITYREGSMEVTVNDTQTITFQGTHLDLDSLRPQTSEYTFGYSDTHPYNNDGTAAYSSPYNPYGLTSGVLANKTAYLAYLAEQGAAGGDPMDISWAVDENGDPVDLGSARYVRIYTGTLAMQNGTLGEVSTEVCGVYRVNATGTGAATVTPTVRFGRATSAMSVVDTTHMGTQSVSLDRGNTCYVSVASSANHIFVNGVEVTSGENIQFTVTAGTTKTVQIITQSGTEEPYVTVLKISR